jgi:hypothetical protein
MPMDPQTLSSLAADYTKYMTSIRGRRVQRLLKRELSGADFVLVADIRSGGRLVLGVSESGAAICASDGKGKSASVIKWAHGSQNACETRFDLLKDSLQSLGDNWFPLSRLRKQMQIELPAERIPTEAGSLVAAALRVLG